MEIVKESAKEQNDVGLRILKRLLETKRKESNLVFSPLSINLMLCLLAAGISKGQPLHDLLSFLKFNSIDQLNSFLSKIIAFIFADHSAVDGPCVTTANGVWIADDLPLKPSFQNILETLYKGKLYQVDFVNKSAEVVKEANSWVKNETRGLIPEIVDDYTVNGNSRMILANTVYFKAAWLDQFPEGATKNEEFHLSNGGSVEVPFMRSSEDHAVAVFDGFKVASLSYYEEDDDKRRFSMVIFLPDPRDGLPSLIQRACSESGFLDLHRPIYSVEVEKFKIPKFDVEFRFKAAKILKDLGLGSLFSIGSGFTEMVEDPKGRELYVSNMFHRAKIIVDEKGTEAAAVTVSEMMGGCLKENPVRVNFVADHPFLFLIRENVTGIILFIGQLLNPSPK